MKFYLIIQLEDGSEQSRTFTKYENASSSKAAFYRWSAARARHDKDYVPIKRIIGPLVNIRRGQHVIDLHKKS